MNKHEKSSQLQTSPIKPHKKTPELSQLESRSNSPKLFIYPEPLSASSPPAFPPTPRNYSKLMQNFRLKIQKSKIEARKFKRNLEDFNLVHTSNFIQKIRNELEAKIRSEKGKQFRSCSNTRNEGNMKKDKLKAILGPAVLKTNVVPIEFRKWNKRKDSNPECMIDFQKIDVNYVQGVMAGLY